MRAREILKSWDFDEYLQGQWDADILEGDCSESEVFAQMECDARMMDSLQFSTTHKRNDHRLCEDEFNPKSLY